MKRRSFLKGLAAAVVSVPVLKSIQPTVEKLPKVSTVSEAEYSAKHYADVSAKLAQDNFYFGNSADYLNWNGKKLYI